MFIVSASWTLQILLEKACSRWRVRFPGTLVESVQISDAEKLLDAVAKAAGVDRGNFVRVALRGHPSSNSQNGRPQSAAPTNEIAALLKSLADVLGVSGHEREVRDAFTSALPAWARTRPLGRGAVIRGLDNAAIAPLAELDRILNIARAQNIPVQVGATNGGTDGSDFVRYGALHVSLSWPGRYSHSPVEVLDLRDLQALEKLIYAIATSP